MVAHPDTEDRRAGRAGLAFAEFQSRSAVHAESLGPSNRAPPDPLGNSRLSDSGIAVARLAGIALLCLALACWPGGDDATQPAIRALFTYNLLAALYLGYLRVGGGFVSYLLWPACVLHAVRTLLPVRAARARTQEQK